uniref:Uncharacterized protein n=1 Tax=Anopheles maculatus TaxID=74869 RepID=A0A182SA70_9DIPT
MKLDRRIEEAAPTGQQLQELGMRLRCDDASSDQDEFLDEERLMLDRSPDELDSNDGDMDDLDSDNDLGDELMHATSDGERIIYPWMKKIHVAGVGEYKVFFFTSHRNLLVSHNVDKIIRHRYLHNATQRCQALLVLRCLINWLPPYHIGESIGVATDQTTAAFFNTYLQALPEAFTVFPKLKFQTHNIEEY